MNKAAIFHISESFMAYATGYDKLNIRLRADKKDKLDVSLLYTYKCDDPRIWQEVKMKKTFIGEYHAYFEIDIKLRDKRFSYIFKIEDKNETYYLSENGLEEVNDFSRFYFTSFHMPYINEADFFKPVEWMKDAVFYQIFVERFRRGDFSKDDSYINQAWTDLPSPNSFAGRVKADIEKINYETFAHVYNMPKLKTSNKKSRII